MRITTSEMGFFVALTMGEGSMLYQIIRLGVSCVCHLTASRIPHRNPSGYSWREIDCYSILIE